jgi:hypothetical protein
MCIVEDSVLIKQFSIFGCELKFERYMIGYFDQASPGTFQATLGEEQQRIFQTVGFERV